MSVGILTTALLGWLLGQTPANDVYFSNQRAHKIPLNFEDALRRDIRELTLYTSTDQGKTWLQAQKISPNQDHFVFTAPGDGFYWLQVATINHQGKQEPSNIYTAPPAQKMIIDTLRPFIRVVTAQRQGDEVLVQWEVTEDNPDWSTFQVEYQTPSSLSWTKAAVTPAFTGQVRFNPSTTAPVVVRVSMTDVAKNISSVNATVVGPGQAPVIQQTIGVNTTTNSGPVMPPPNFPTPTDPVMPPMQTPTPVQPPVTQPPVSPPPSQTFTTSQPPAVEPPLPKPVTAPVQSAVTPPPAPTWTPPKNAEPAHNLIADSLTPPPIPAGTPTNRDEPPTTTTVTQRRPLPPLQYVNNPEITLEYEISKVGPSGIGLVNFYMTRDDGQTWKLFGYDDQDLKQGRYQRLVRLDGDGVYGFIVVVKNKAGLGRELPKSGDSPDIRFEVDTLPPVAQLFEPRPDRTKANALILSWNAADQNLAPNPISLEWADKVEGPWRPIAVNLPNSKEHSWQLPEGLPYQVFLRLRVRDQAGNEGVAVTQRAQIVDLSVPESRVVGVGPAPK